MARTPLKKGTLKAALLRAGIEEVAKETTLSGVSGAAAEVLHERWQSVPLSVRGLFVRASRGSRAAAIKAKCMECVGFVRRDVVECAVYTCPLWTHRPYTSETQRQVAVSLTVAGKPVKHAMAKKYRAALTHKPSAVRVYCIECGGGADRKLSETRDNVKGCGAVACPLWNFRPWKWAKKE